MSAMETSNLTKEYLIKMLSEDKRFDGRKLLEHRELSVSYEVSNKAEGSARVKLGKTEVLVGVKLAPGTPYPDSMDKGNLVVSGDLLPMASPRFESGPPEFNAIELPRLIDRAIRESGMIDMKKLVIKEGEKVWTVYIDIYPVNDDGNLIDAACIATIAALKKTMLPVLDKDGRIDSEKEGKESFPISKETAPISFSFFKIGSSLIVDPTREEEEAADSRITFGLSKWNSEYMINSAQKNGETPFTRQEIEKIAEILPKKFDEINEKLKKLL